MPLQHMDHRSTVNSAQESQMDEARIARIVAISLGSLWFVVLGLNKVSGL
jgi:hypothetical protein